MIAYTSLTGSKRRLPKLRAAWGTFSREVGCHYHVGRVNSQRRIHLCAQAGAHSFDGSSASMLPDKLEVLERGRRQLNFILDG